MTEAANVDCVVFDLMGVLYDGGRFITEGLVPQMQHRIHREELIKRYIALAVGKLGREAFWHGMCDDWQEAEHELLSSLKPAHDLHTIRDLKNHCCLGLLTEIPTDWGDILLQRADLHSLFDVAIVSGREGLTKPNPAIYHLLNSRLPSGGRRIYIDDKPENLVPASELGFITIWMQHSGRTCPENITPDHTVSSLAEARDVIGRILNV